MGDKSDQAPSGIDPGMQKRPDGNASNGELQVIEHVKEDLVKSGVKREQAPRVASRVVEYVASYHSGPLPSVREFRGYEDICPGAARDILTMAQKDQDHEHRMDVVRVRGEIFLKFSGMVFVLLVFALMIGGAIYAAQGGHEKLAIAIASGTGLTMVAGVCARILLGRPSQPPQPKPKAPKKISKRK